MVDMEDNELERIDMLESDLRDALRGLPFKTTNLSTVTRGPFFEISRVDGESEYGVGFVAEAENIGWFGGFFARNEISVIQASMRAALVWLLNEHINEVIGK
jgi:hypothetical protein